MLKTIKLTGEQKKVLFLPVQNPIQIKGVAGSGKTTVALYRTKHILDTQSNLFQEAKVAIFTFNKTLSSYISKISHHIEGGYKQNSDELVVSDNVGIKAEITNFHKWAYRFIEEHGIKFREIVFVDGRAYTENKIITEDEKEEIINISKSKYQRHAIASKSTEFFREEIAWIKGKLFSIEDEYIDAKRIGRGTADRVTQEDKKTIWDIYYSYKAELKNRGLYDFDDFAILALDIINSNSDFKPPYSHIVIDEAQDLNKAQILVLTKLVSPETNSITIIADAAQRIYKSGFSWKEAGLNVVGSRTIEFKKNYRNTVQIVRAALSLLENEPDKSEFTEVEAALKGEKKPIIGYFNNNADQFNYLRSELDKLIGSNQIFSTVVLHRNNLGLNAISNLLLEAGYTVERIKGEVDYNSDAIKTCTLSSIKGLEFSNVFILDLNDDIIPFPKGFADDNDEYHISTERRLLYTAMTRARKSLYLLCSGIPSRYLSEIDEEYVDIQHGTTSVESSDDYDDLPF